MASIAFSHQREPVLEWHLNAGPTGTVKLEGLPCCIGNRF